MARILEDVQWCSIMAMNVMNVLGDVKWCFKFSSICAYIDFSFAIRYSGEELVQIYWGKAGHTEYMGTNEVLSFEILLWLGVDAP